MIASLLDGTHRRIALKATMVAQERTADSMVLVLMVLKQTESKGGGSESKQKERQSSETKKGVRDIVRCLLLSLALTPGQMCIAVLLLASLPPNLGGEEVYSYSTILQRDPRRLRLSQGASLMPDESVE